jgi:fructose-bisphosphate aldolase class I
MIAHERLSDVTATARALVAPGKGILAADESFPTIEKRLGAVDVLSTEEHRRTYRELLFTTPGIGEFLSGVILFDETIRQRATDGRLFPEVLAAQGIVPGIKVDAGTKPMPDSPDEKVTEGLDGLAGRLAEYRKLGARFAKWRAVITIDGDRLPTGACLKENARRLADYAAVCQTAGFVPIVEPEVLMEGNHSLARCAEVTAETLRQVFAALAARGVALEGMLLKPNMVLAGRGAAAQPSPREVADATLRVLAGAVPHEVPGIVFLSGGQGAVEATVRLNEMNKLGPHPWILSFSYGRALEDSVLEAWRGKPENVRAAQQVFYHRARMNGLACLGRYTPELEAAGSELPR